MEPCAARPRGFSRPHPAAFALSKALDFGPESRGAKFLIYAPVSGGLVRCEIKSKTTALLTQYPLTNGFALIQAFKLNLFVFSQFVILSG